MKSSNCKAGWEGGGVTKGEKWRGGEGKGECVSQLKKDGKDVNLKPQCVKMLEIYFMSISLKITS